ncbi:MAG: efflux RND transporter periplasmic adaptor subunit [Vicinamibacterales bacterium]
MKNRKRVGLVATGVLVLALAGWGISRLNGAAPALDPSLVATAERGTLVSSVVATGKVEPITKIEIKSKANGIIERLLVEVDQLVRPGQVLAELDREILTARQREANANLQAAQAAHEGAVAQWHKNEVEAEAPDVEFARRNLARAQRLFDQKLLSSSGLDESKIAVEQAQNRQRAATGQLAIGRARVSEAEANVAQARAAVERAVEDLASATIRSPIHATVLTRDVELGSPVSSILNMGAAATLVMTLGDIEHVFVRGKVDESDIGRVKLGQPARITTETFRGKIFEGRVTQISPIGVDKDNVTTFEVKVSIDNPGQVLKANMTANAELIIDEFRDSLLIPEAALVYDAERHPFVDLVDAASKTGRRRVPVTVGVGNGSRIQVLGGLKAGDRVVLPG